MLDQTYEMYQFLINSTSNNNQKSKWYKQVADFCLEWGMVNEANAALRKKLALEVDCFQSYESTVNELRDVQQNKAKYEEKYA